MKKISFYLNLLIAILLMAHTTINAQDWKIEKTLQGDSIGYASLRYSASEQGFAAIDRKGNIQWQIPVPGLVLGIGKFKNNVLIFYTKEFRDQIYTQIKDIHAAIISPKQRKIITDKIVFANEGKTFIEPTVLTDPSGNFNNLIIRNTGQSIVHFPLFFGPENRYNETATLSAISLSEDLSVERKGINSAAIGANLAAICSGKQNDFYITTFANDQLITERFDGQEKPSQTLSLSLPYKNKSYFNAIISFDSLATNAVDVLVRYENQNKKELVTLYRFDFEAKKTIAAPDVVLNKDYENELKEGQPEKVKSSNLKRIEELKPVQIIETNDKIIVLKEIQYVYSMANRDAAPRYTREDGIISIYTKDLHLVKDIVVDKDVETFIAGANSIGGIVRAGKLYVVSMESGGIAAYKNALYTVNLNNGTADKKILDRGDAHRGLVLDPASIFWFPENFITPLVSARAMFSIKYVTTLQSQLYQ